MKKSIVIILALFSFYSLFGMSVVSESAGNSFDSYPMLEAYYDKETHISDSAFWDNLKIELLTVSKSDPLYSWFGHCAVLVTPPSGNSVMYDYGTFAFGKGFYANFAMGRLWYTCSSSIGAYRLAEMKTDRRTISAVELDLSPTQKYAVVNFLMTNSSDGYNVYLYNHYTDNCATRIRDLLDFISEGDFRAWAEEQSGLSFRQQTSRILVNNRIVMWALDFLQSGNIDSDATLWDEMFLPENLEKAVLEYGKFGTKQVYYSDFRGKTDRPENSTGARNNILYSCCVAVLICSLAFIGLKKSKVVYKIQGFTVNLVLGLMGCVLFFMMNFTSHNVTFMNENILFINPLLLVIAFMTLSDRFKPVIKWFYRILSGIILVLIVLKLVLPNVFLQNNWSQIIVMLPYCLINSQISLRRL